MTKEIFAQQVQTAFAYLTLLGFHSKVQEDGSVRIESSSCYLTIYFDSYSYETGLAWGTSESDETFSMSELLRLITPGCEYRDCAAESAEGQADCIRQLAERFREVVTSGVLQNTVRLFEHLSEDRKQWAKNYELETKIATARIRLAEAWRLHDFREVVDILRPLREHLSRAELTKLEYASRQTES